LWKPLSVHAGKIFENNTEYFRAVAVGDLAKARGLKNMYCLCERADIYGYGVYVMP